MYSTTREVDMSGRRNELRSTSCGDTENEFLCDGIGEREGKIGKGCVG